jgi:hypothetical protein
MDVEDGRQLHAELILLKLFWQLPRYDGICEISIRAVAGPEQKLAIDGWNLGSSMLRRQLSELHTNGVGFGVADAATEVDEDTTNEEEVGVGITEGAEAEVIGLVELEEEDVIPTTWLDVMVGAGVLFWVWRLLGAVVLDSAPLGDVLLGAELLSIVDGNLQTLLHGGQDGWFITLVLEVPCVELEVESDGVVLLETMLEAVVVHITVKLELGVLTELLDASVLLIGGIATVVEVALDATETLTVVLDNMDDEEALEIGSVAFLHCILW